MKCPYSFRPQSSANTNKASIVWSQANYKNKFISFRKIELINKLTSHLHRNAQKFWAFASPVHDSTHLKSNVGWCRSSLPMSLWWIFTIFIWQECAEFFSFFTLEVWYLYQIKRLCSHVYLVTDVADCEKICVVEALFTTILDIVENLCNYCAGRCILSEVGSGAGFHSPVKIYRLDDSAFDCFQ